MVLLNGCAGSGLDNSSKRFTNPIEMHSSDWDDLLEMDRAWQAALVRIPAKSANKYIKTTIGELAFSNVAIERTYPAVIYMHGCSGIWDGTRIRLDFLAKNGYAVIAPASFARKKYPKSCAPSAYQGGLYRPTLKMRQHDAGYAIAKAKRLDWVDADNVFLMGLSQGGITTATFSSKDNDLSVNARIVEGWTCHAGWPEYQGVNAPDNEPVLTLVGKNDPWFQDIWTKGNCAKFLNPSNGSQSIVFSDGYLSFRHELLESKQVKKIVLEFLKQHTN